MPDLNRLLALRELARGALHCFAWKQGARSRYWLPDGKQDTPGNRVYGARALKAEAAARSPAKAASAPASGAQRVAAMKAQVARESYEAAAKAPAGSVPPAQLDMLRRRAEAAAAEAKAPAQASKAVPLSALPKVPPVERAAAAKPAPKAPTPAPVTAPKVQKADKTPVVRREPTKVKGKPVVAVGQTNRAGVAVAKARIPQEVLDEKQKRPGFLVVSRADDRHYQIAHPDDLAHAARAGVPTRFPVTDLEKSIGALLKHGRVSVIEPEEGAFLSGRATGVTPDLKALRDTVEAGIVSNARTGWNYDFSRARAALADASKQIDDFARAKPRQVAALAKQVTGSDASSTEDGVKKLKKWVGETLALLSQEPDDTPGRGRQRFSERGGRVAWFAEVQPRMLGMARLVAALAV